MKIANKISLSFLITSIILTFLAAPYLYFFSKQAFEKSVYMRLLAAAESRADHIETFLDNKKSEIQLIAQSERMKKALENNVNGASFSGAVLEDLDRQLVKFSDSDKDIYEIFVMDRRGKIIASSIPENLGLDKSADAYFLGGQQGPYIKDAYYSSVTGRPSMAAAAPVFSNVTGKLIGVVSSRIELDSLYAITRKSTGLGKTGEIFIINKYGYMITPSRTLKDTFLKQRITLSGERSAVLEEGEAGDNSVVYTDIDYRGIRVLGVKVDIPLMGWILLAEIDRDEILLPLRRIQMVLLSIILFVPLFGWLAGKVVGRTFTAPIQRLVKHSKIVGEGHFDHKVEMLSKDEIGELSTAFDKMTESLKNTTTSISALNKEIEKRKASEKRAKLTAKEWQDTFDSITDLISIQDKDFRILKVNKAYADAFGMKPEKIEGKICHELVHGTKEPWPTCPTKEVLISKKAARAEFFEPKMGAYLEVLTTPILDENGLLTGIVHVVKDISTRKKTEAAIVESETKHKALYEKSKDAIMILTPEKGFTGGNSATLSLFGFTDESQFVRKSPGDLSPEKQPDGSLSSEKARKMMEIAMKEGSNFFEWTHKKITGEEFPATVLLTKMDIGGEACLQATVRDISGEKKAEEAIMESARIKSDFTSMVSHELRTPLTAIKEGIGIVLDGAAGELNDEQKDFLATSKRNVDRLTRLINDVLDFTKLEAGRMVIRREKNSIKDVIEDVAKLQRTRAEEKGIYLKTEVSDGTPQIQFDIDRITQVVTNLASNAIKFTEKGGVTISAGVAGDTVRVSVEDTGAGIKEQDIDKLFQEFRQLEDKNARKTGGTGLGLAISKKIVEQHAGAIWAESEFGKGARFIFTLPLVTMKKILAIDDETGALELYKKILSKNDYKVTTAATGMEGIEKAKKEKPDLIILDMKLPDINGYEVLGRLMSEMDMGAVSVLAVSGFAEELDKFTDRGVGRKVPCLSKPFDTEVFMSTVEGLLGKSG